MRKIYHFNRHNVLHLMSWKYFTFQNFQFLHAVRMNFEVKHMRCVNYVCRMKKGDEFSFPWLESRRNATLHSLLISLDKTFAHYISLALCSYINDFISVLYVRERKKGFPNVFLFGRLCESVMQSRPCTRYINGWKSYAHVFSQLQQ